MRLPISFQYGGSVV